MEHNLEIDWHTGDIHMTRCLATCRPMIEMDDSNDTSEPKNESAKNTKRHPGAKSHHQVHIKEVLEHNQNALNLHKASHIQILRSWAKMANF